MLAFTSFLFFVSVFAVATAYELLFPPALLVSWQPRFPEIFVSTNPLIILLVIFGLNLVLSAFIVVTLPGFVFFPLSVVMLLFRGYLWGVLLPSLPTWFVLASMPTLILEGLGYALAAVAGTIVGVSWLKPKLLYREETVSRVDAFRKALKESRIIYVFVIIILFVAAIVETVTLILMGHLVV